MRILDNNEVKLCTEKFEKLITQEGNINDLFSILDEILYDYANYVIGENNSCPTNIQACSLFYLKKLRDTCIS